MAPLREKFYEKLAKWFDDSHTLLQLWVVFLFELKLAIGDPTGLQYLLDSVSLGLLDFIQRQRNIGWENIFCGFISSSLGEYMEDRMRDNDYCDGFEWVVIFLCLVQTWVADTWHRLCKIEHDKNKQDASATRLQLKHRITTVFGFQHQVPPVFRRCFRHDLEYFQDKSDNFLRNWLELYEELITQAATDPQHQTFLTEFFK